MDGWLWPEAVGRAGAPDVFDDGVDDVDDVDDVVDGREALPGPAPARVVVLGELEWPEVGAAFALRETLLRE
ncbi:MAG: hypothetical protein ACYCV7_09785 [Acidimicrobiales bacterium]